MNPSLRPTPRTQNEPKRARQSTPQSPPPTPRDKKQSTTWPLPTRLKNSRNEPLPPALIRKIRSGASKRPLPPNKRQPPLLQPRKPHSTQPPSSELGAS